MTCPVCNGKAILLAYPNYEGYNAVYRCISEMCDYTGGYVFSPRTPNEDFTLGYNRGYDHARINEEANAVTAIAELNLAIQHERDLAEF